MSGVIHPVRAARGEPCEGLRPHVGLRVPPRQIPRVQRRRRPPALPGRAARLRPAPASAQPVASTSPRSPPLSSAPSRVHRAVPGRTGRRPGRHPSEGRAGPSGERGRPRAARWRHAPLVSASAPRRPAHGHRMRHRPPRARRHPRHGGGGPQAPGRLPARTAENRGRTAALPVARACARRPGRPRSRAGPRARPPPPRRSGPRKHR